VNVVFPLAGLGVSGGVKNLMMQADALCRAGHQVRLLIPDFAPAPPFSIDARVQIVRLATGPSGWPRMLRRAVYYARLALETAHGADLCIVAYYLTAYCAVVSRILRRSRTTILYSVSAYEPVTHGLAAESSPPVRIVRALFARLSYRLPTRRVYASHWLRAQVGDTGATVIGRGVDTSVFHPAAKRLTDPAAPLRLGAIGRSGPVKGYRDLLLAIRDLAAPVPLEVVVVALDPLPLPSGVPARLLPPRSEAEMGEFYRGCDIFVFTSLSEGFPAPPLEAMASGCAVVTTDCGGVREYAVDGTNCLIVSTGDPVAVRRALERVCGDPDLRARLAASGRATALQFGRDKMLERLLAIIGPEGEQRPMRNLAR